MVFPEAGLPDAVRRVTVMIERCTGFVHADRKSVGEAEIVERPAEAMAETTVEKFTATVDFSLIPSVVSRAE